MSENRPEETTQDDILRSAKLKLYTGGEGGERPASLAVDVYNGNPSLIVYTNVKGDENNDGGRIRAPLDPVGFGMLIEAIKAAHASPKAGRWQLDCSTHPKNQAGERSKEAQHTSTITVSRHEDGMLKIAVTATDPGRPKKEFAFQIPSNRYIAMRIRGDEAPAIAINHMAAMSWVSVMEKIIFPRIMLTYKAPPKPDNAGRFGGNQGGGKFRSGGGGYNNGGGNNYNRKPQAPPAGGGGARREMDDDIDF